MSDLFDGSFMTDVQDTQDFWGAPYSDNTNMTSYNNETMQGLGADSSPQQSAFAGAEDPSNRDPASEPYGPPKELMNNSTDKFKSGALTAVGSGLKALGSPVTRQNLDRNSSLYKYYGNAAARAFSPGQLGTSAPAQAGSVGALKATDAQSLHTYWMSRLQQFANPQQQGKR